VSAFSLCLVSATGDRRVGRGFAGDLDDVLDAGAERAVHDVQLLVYDRRGHEHHARDASHRCIDARGHVEVTLEDFCSVERRFIV
jgi:hypothetical protein